ncbi:MAG: exosome non-catalytic core subunit rrp40 [Cirrosporium novae-zelandiae]|nr:MAG: exosome non-catalytic core subunit rrp40 [Cirrosporium novae-zelandiae]
MTSLSSSVLLPGDTIPSAVFPPLNPNAPLKLSAGLTHQPPDSIITTLPGTVTATSNSSKASSLSLQTLNSGRYIPLPGDLLIAQVHHTTADYHVCMLTPHAPFALLPVLAFENATRKTRPLLSAGSLIYARVLSANKNMDVELTCVNPATGKSDGLGELKGGMVFDISKSMARNLMGKGGAVILEELGSKGLSFEVAVGKNGRFWVDSGNIRETLMVGTAVTDVDELRLSVADQKRLVQRLLKAR